jgi:hypothetical protein
MGRIHHSGKLSDFMGLLPKILILDYSRARDSKNRSVATELRNKNWIRSLRDITIAELLKEFIMLYTTLSSIQLSDQPDEVIWRWTANEKFTMASA